MYELGVVVALAIVFIRLIYAFLSINSKRSKNLALIGRRLSYLSLSVKPLTKTYINKHVSFKILRFLGIWLVLPLILIFLSWLYVIYLLGIHLYQFSQLIGMPNDVKEYIWKIGNLDLNFDQMVELTYNYTKSKDLTLEQFKKGLDEYLNEL